MSLWRRWHEDYEDAGSDLSQRLIAVKRRLREAVDATREGPIQLISACAGAGLDVAGAFEGHPRAHDVRGALIEIDEGLARLASENMRRSGLDGIEVRQADAGVSDSYEGTVPASILLLCGIFGNVSPDDVQNTVQRCRMLCAPGATVIWTRHRRSPDQSPIIRGWFADAGFTELAFDSPGSDRFAVCTERLSGDPAPFTRGTHLFTFVEIDTERAVR
jgi:hypothetical protein